MKMYFFGWEHGRNVTSMRKILFSKNSPRLTTVFTRNKMLSVEKNLTRFPKRFKFSAEIMFPEPLRNTSTIRKNPQPPTLLRSFKSEDSPPPQLLLNLTPKTRSSPSFPRNLPIFTQKFSLRWRSGFKHRHLLR